MDRRETSLPPPHSIQIPSNPWARAYASRHTNPDCGIVTLDGLELLEHVNCSYLSSGTAPTLLALKKHAQSLANIIRTLAPSTKTKAVGALDGDGDLYDGFPENEAFDWLNRLDQPYENDDDSHHIPLWSLANEIKDDFESKGVQYHCPLSQVPDTGPLADGNGLRRPYMTHQNLVMHANECLEILDHEYSATGGLMSILPLPAEEGMASAIGAENTLLGQWLFHHQALVARMHELEISYANALDALGGEANVPFQIMRRAGPDGISNGREIAYPQDRYILVNAGDDVTSHIHRLLDRNEATYKQKQKIWSEHDAAGERMWDQERGGNWYTKGLVPVDLLTRFYRIAGKGHDSPIFVLPAVEQHPGVSHTREIEKQPTVVSAVPLSWPKRVSEWETNYQARIDDAEKREEEVRQLKNEIVDLTKAMAAKDEEIRRSRNQLAFWESHVGKSESDRHDALLEQISAYKAKMEKLHSELPSQYQVLLDIENK
ncbi:hypothetical protein BGZ63DRAFT_359103 [Mariannaea sp. PMI_226]|nr:hypothetical protein BGZ63DRAFT_359103 [Mariannaea sp. PMI_226]